MARTDDNVKEFPEKLFNERVAYGETGALYATGLLDPRYHGRHTELTHSQVMMADMCIAELASAGGQALEVPFGGLPFGEQGALPAKGKEYPGLGYKRARDKPPKAQQLQQPAEAQ
ncbi:hypothetical protein QJQ45_005180 [Haematococcus lacustris]|nr:hypothetical protein QJQ45_005180 [Haematococcus lacustris]